MASVAHSHLQLTQGITKDEAKSFLTTAAVAFLVSTSLMKSGVRTEQHVKETR